jgi:hypothetical protein
VCGWRLAATETAVQNAANASRENSRAIRIFTGPTAEEFFGDFGY